MAEVAAKKKAPKGTGTTVTIDLSEYPELLNQIKASAKGADYPPSIWMRRRIVKLHADKVLFKDGE